MVTTWMPTVLGLGSIPLIVHPIDEGVDWFMDLTFRRLTGLTSKSDDYPTIEFAENKSTPQTNTMLSNALGSAAASIIARLSTHPLDTAKARLQSLNGSAYRGPFDVLHQTFRTEGIGGLYRGFSSVIVGGTPGTIVYLCSYDWFKEKISAATREPAISIGEESFLVHLSSGILAETVACLIYVPVDVVKERLQIQHKSDSFQYKGGWDALIKISQNEGLRGIYKGYGATVVSFGPFSALYFVFYEKFKVWSKHYLQQSSVDEEDIILATLPFPWILMSSASAGALASFLTSPLDMAKLRLQVQRGAQQQSSASVHTTNHRGMLDALSYAYQSGGIRGLFRGAGARVLHFVPAITITMTTYETCRTFFQDVL